jgi:hypothetical protein
MMVNVAKADLWEVLRALADQFVPELASAIKQAFGLAKAHLDPAALQAAIESGSLDAVAEVALGVPSPDNPLYEEVRAAMQRAITRAVRQWDAELTLNNQPLLAVGLGEDVGQNPYALQFIRTYPLDRIRQIDENTRAGIRFYVRRALAEGQNPRSLIPQLAGAVQPNGGRAGGIIGLTTHQAQFVYNYRKQLEAADPRALDRALRDKRSDAAVRAAVEGTKALSPEQIQTLVTKYEGRWLGYRAEVIARTEAMRALAAGQRLEWDTAIQQGRIAATSLQKRWVTAHDERVRPLHQELSNMTIPYTDLFPTGDAGPVWGPPAVPNCRCVLWIAPK